jgi:hydrogenase-4 component F
MLAYSSVEHMGILSVGAALGPAGVWAALFHVWSNGLTKGALFLSAGNMRRAGGSSRRSETTGLARLTPWSARIFLAGMFAVTACPPFGPFFSELRILRAGLGTGNVWVALLFLGSLLLAFFGLSRLVFAVTDGRPRLKTRTTPARFRETAGVLVPPLVFLGLSLWLGLATPACLGDAWTAATGALAPPP